MEEFIKMIVGDFEIIPEVYVLIRLSVIYFIFNYVLDLFTATRKVGRSV